MHIEESMDIAFDETNKNMQESNKTGPDDEVPTVQSIGIDLYIDSEKSTQLQKNQSVELGIKSIESDPDAKEIRSKLPKEWWVPRNLSLDNVIGQMQKGVSTRRSLNHFCEHMTFFISSRTQDSSWSFRI